MNKIQAVERIGALINIELNEIKHASFISATVRTHTFRNVCVIIDFKVEKGIGELVRNLQEAIYRKSLETNSSELLVYRIASSHIYPADIHQLHIELIMSSKYDAVDKNFIDKLKDLFEPLLKVKDTL